MLQKNHLTCVFRITPQLVIGSRDGTLRVWHLHHGSLITQYDVHAVIRDMRITGDASRMIVRLEDSNKLPLLCLHNSPAGEVKSQSQIDIEVQGGKSYRTS